MADDNLAERVKQMRSQGYQNSQIIDILQRDGHSSSEIFDALNHSSIGDASARPTSGPDLPPAPKFNNPSNDAFSKPMPADDDMPSVPPPPSGGSSQQHQAATPPNLTRNTAQQPPTPQMQAPQPAPQPAPSPPAQRSAPANMPSTSDVSTEEYIEAIIDEKWVQLEDDIQKIVDWKNRSEQRLTQLSQQVGDLKDRFEKLHEALIGKIESYDKNILEVGAEIKAMEKVFSKVLPTFTDNVKQLQDITDDLGKKTSKK